MQSILFRGTKSASSKGFGRNAYDHLESWQAAFLAAQFRRAATQR
jgi:hypothetical protein